MQMRAATVSADGRAKAFLDLLRREAADAIPGEGIAVVVAHPDDETIGIGGQLTRLRGATIVHVTDGAPRNDAARAHGFATPQAYAAARYQELRAALALVGITEDALVTLGVADQEASLYLCDLARRLARLFEERQIDLVVTHAFEGGHPDHDAAAFAAHAAGVLMLLAGRELAIVEMPFYHLGPMGWTMQRFVAVPGLTECEIRLGDAQRRRKQAMLDAHVTQQRVLSRVATDVERFRPASAYDFTVLPNDGRLLYDLHGWGMTGRRWQALAGAALQGLGLGAVA